jgi:hypothetical protein
MEMVNHLRRLWCVLAPAALALVAISSPVRADVLPGAPPSPDDPFIFNFDENGHGSISINGGAFQTLNGTLMADPTWAGHMVMTYIFPNGGTVGNGDVRILEPTGGISDVLRFTNSKGDLTGGNADRMIFYSDFAAGDPDDNALADTGWPTLTGSTSVTEVGPEGSNSFQYLAGPPGNANVYNGTSDATAVPEPGSIGLLGTVVGFAGMALRRRRK